MKADDVAVAGCPSVGPHGARCEIRYGHIAQHAGTDSKGVWRQW